MGIRKEYKKYFGRQIKDECIHDAEDVIEFAKHYHALRQHDVIGYLVELAKKEYGEYEEEIIGYELGYCDGTETHWSEEVCPLDELNPDDFYGEPTEKDIANRRLSNEQYYWYGEENQYCIAKRVNVLNRGWKIELLHTINGL